MNYELLQRRFRSNKDTEEELRDKITRTESTKNRVDIDLNNLKPEIKEMQSEKGMLYR